MEECLECGDTFLNKAKLYRHVRDIHKMRMSDYRDKHHILKCKKCGKDLWSDNKSGYCTKCIDRSTKTLKLWQTPSYRKSVIDAVSKPRREGFGKEQSKRMKEWWDAHPERKIEQGKHMEKSWREGKITAIPRSNNTSSGERALYKDIVNLFSEATSKVTIRIGNRWFFPDILLEKEGIIIEYFGDYWHANPKVYAEDDIVRWGISAAELWFSDKKRIEILESAGYIIEVVFQMEYRENREEVLEKFNSLYNWESCSL